jgi:SAM-dependent methyltransferase
MASTSAPTLAQRLRALWASGDYPSMVETFLLPLGPRLVDACGIGPGMRVLDVAAGTGNASLVAAARGAEVTASDITPELLEAGRARAVAAGLGLEWVEADAMALPFEDASFDVVISCIGVMFAPLHQAAADELVRVCRPGGTIGLLCWTPDGLLGRVFAALGPYAPPPPAGATPPPRWGDEAHQRALLDDRVELTTVHRDALPITAFASADAYVDHFVGKYGPAIAAFRNAEATGRLAEADAALRSAVREHDRGIPGRAHFEQEYLLTVGTRR